MCVSSSREETRRDETKRDETERDGYETKGDEKRGGIPPVFRVRRDPDPRASASSPERALYVFFSLLSRARERERRYKINRKRSRDLER